MKVSEFISQEIHKIKEMKGRKKWQYIWDYYQWPIIITVFLVVSVIVTTISKMNEKEIVLSGFLFDSYYTTEHDEPFADFPDFAELDKEKYTQDFRTNLTMYGIYAETSQQFYATVAAGHTDFVASNPQTFLRLSYDCFKYFYDLREILSPQQLEKLSDRLFYVDASMLDKLDSQEETVYLPDHDKPETMKEPVPIGIDIRSGTGVDVLYLGEEPVFMAVVNNAPHLDLTLKFLDYLEIYE